MPTYYKMTASKEESYSTGQKFGLPMEWGEGVEHTTEGAGDICTQGWIHAFTSLNAASMFRLVYGCGDYTVMWEAEGNLGVQTAGKVGCCKMKTVREIPAPAVATAAQKKKFTELARAHLEKSGRVLTGWFSDSEFWLLWAVVYDLRENNVANNIIEEMLTEAMKAEDAKLPN